MDQLIEWAIYGGTFLIVALVLLVYILKQRRESKRSEEKLATAREENLHEPVSIYPYIDPDRCFKSGACAMACPETDVLGIRHGRAVLINASHCIGHGACMRACPVEAISLRIGTEKRGVDLPHLNPNFETNVKGIFVAGELGGMGLIRNAVTQGKEAVDNIFKSLRKEVEANYDLIVVGAGPAGISHRGRVCAARCTRGGRCCRPRAGAHSASGGRGRTRMDRGGGDVAAGPAGRPGRAPWRGTPARS